MLSNDFSITSFAKHQNNTRKTHRAKIIGKTQRGCMNKIYKWELQDLINSTNGYTSFQDWLKVYKNTLYKTACRRGWLEELYNILPKPSLKKRRDEDLLEMAKRCKNHTDIVRLDPSGYRALLDRGLGDIAFAHFETSDKHKSWLYSMYSYIFDDGAIYIGITRDPEGRHKSHSCDKRSPVFMYYETHKINYKYQILHTNMNAALAKKMEKNCISEARLSQLKVLNKDNGGGLGGHAEWSKDILKEIFQRYTSVSEILKEEPRAYKTATNRGLLKELSAHMTKKRITWDLQKCRESAKSYINCRTWQKKGKGSVQFVRKQNLNVLQFFLEAKGWENSVFYTILQSKKIIQKNDEICIAWACADIIRDRWIENGKCGWERLFKVVGIGNKTSYCKMLKKFRDGWIPKNDPFWTEWSKDQRIRLDI
jgi:predicted GIY-YIG superfamily endonuclease